MPPSAIGYTKVKCRTGLTASFRSGKLSSFRSSRRKPVWVGINLDLFKKLLNSAYKMISYALINTKATVVPKMKRMPKTF